jgi:hypothetical protein
MKALKVDENGFKWMKNGQNGLIFGDKNVFLGPNFAKNRLDVKKIRLRAKFCQ